MKSFILVLLLLVAPLSALAQENQEYVEVDVNESRPKNVLVWPGGKKDVVRLYGRGFELVKKAEIYRGQQVCKDVTCKFRVVAHGMADVEVTATSAAQPGEDYQLLLFTPKNSYPIEYLPVEVRDPNE